MLLYHPLLLQSPWQAPDDLDKQIDELLQANEPALVARSMSTSAITSYDKDNAIKRLEVITTSIKQTLLRIYTLSSHSFHVLIRELKPSARFDKNSLFTHIKGARTDHIISLRAHHGKIRSSWAVALTPEQLKPYSASCAHLKIPWGHVRGDWRQRPPLHLERHSHIYKSTRDDGIRVGRLVYPTNIALRRHRQESPRFAARRLTRLLVNRLPTTRRR